MGAANARRYFPKGTNVIELQLDHLRIECGLPANFWRGQFEIRDPRLSLWLEHKVRCTRPLRKTVVQMTPLGGNSFRLEPATPNETSRGSRTAAFVPKAELDATAETGGA